MQPSINENTIFGIVINKLADGTTEISVGIGHDRDLTINSLYEYMLDEGLTRENEAAVQLLEILTSALEGVKASHPAFAASVRRMNIDYIKNKKDPDDLSEIRFGLDK